MTELVNLLRKKRSSAEVVDATLRFGLNELMDDPPSRQYLISRERGIDLLLEEDHVIAVQIFAQATRKFSAFSDALPLGLRSGMSQAEVHRMLGTPLESDAHDSKFALPDMKAKLIVSFDELSTVKYLSLEST